MYVLKEEKKHPKKFQRPKLSKNMQFGADVDIYMAQSKMKF